VLFDTNVVLDLLLNRKPHSGPAAELFARVESGELSGYIGATTVTTIHYLAEKAVGARRARVLVSRLLNLVEVAPVSRAVLEAALETGISDHEDAVPCEAARQVDAQAIVTRNRPDFRNAPLPVHTPAEMIKLLRLKEEAD
jgi:predicted nucleic acid-binding protein